MKEEKSKELPDEVRKAGFTSIDDFIKANLHYLPESTQRLFNIVNGFENPAQENRYQKGCRDTCQDKPYYRNRRKYNSCGGGYDGKG
jgi:hypothetical protein